MTRMSMNGLTSEVSVTVQNNSESDKLPKKDLYLRYGHAHAASWTGDPESFQILIDL